MYADKKKPKYKLALGIGFAVCTVIGVFDVLLGVGCAIFVSSAIVIDYLTRRD